MKTLFNSEEREFLRNNSQGKLATELTEMFNKEFDRNVLVKQIRIFKKNQKIISGVDCKYKKGELHPLYVPVESERVVRHYKQNEILIKNANCQWEQKERYLYKKYIGEIPNGYTIMFLDGNIENYDLNNLVAVPKKIKNSINITRLRTKSKEMNKASILLFKLKDLIQEKEKE